jgi:hypothetical protein
VTSAAKNEKQQSCRYQSGPQRWDDLIRRYSEIGDVLRRQIIATEDEKLLIGAYLSAEYSYEAAALFNPNIVVRLNQDDAPPEGISFIVSLRGIGEWHVSSVTFRTGSWSRAKGFVIDGLTSVGTHQPKMRSQKRSCCSLSSTLPAFSRGVTSVTCSFSIGFGP